LKDLTGVGAIRDETFEEIKESPPERDALSITPALQWRFNYNKMVKGEVPKGTEHIYGSIGSQSTLSDVAD
jgi:hypothetical protein